MKKKACLISVFLIFILCFTSFAAMKTIPNVIISCTNKVEPNSILSDLEIDTSGSNAGDININVSGKDYYIQSCSVVNSSAKYVKVGDVIKVKVTLVPNDGSTHIFSGTYSSSNVKISGGTYVSSSCTTNSLTVTFNLNPVAGKLPEPENPGWGSSKSSTGSTGTSVAFPDGPGSDTSLKNYISDFIVAPGGPGSIKIEDETASSGKSSSTTSTKNKTRVSGTARWSNPSGGTGYYDVWLYRGSTCIYKLEDYKGTYYDFYPYMTKEGTYHYKIRTVPHTAEQKKYAQRSDFVESDELYIDAQNVSDGKKTDEGPKDSTTVGWVKSGTTWYYRYPNGTLKKNGWEKVNDKWYLFDKEGKMLTGLQTIASGTYYLAATGEMLTGWELINKKWYFFENRKDDLLEGAMYKEKWITEANSKAYYLGSDGVMCIGWKQIGDTWYHFDESGNLSRDAWIDTFYVDKEGKWIQNK